MATHNIHSSWGRTRSAKNLAGANGTACTPEANTNNLRGITGSPASVGYATEAQRFLHVLIEDAHDTAPAATTVFGYINAFQRWFEIPQDNLASTNSAATAASISIADSGRAVAVQVPSDREYRLYHIVGIDRVAFVHEDSGEVNIFAACSTF